MSNCQSGTWKCNKLVAGTHLKPRITGNEIHSIAVLQIELLCRVLEAVVEGGAGCAQGDFVGVHLLERAGFDGLYAGAEDDALAFLDGNLEVAGHPQVLGVGDAALHVFDVFDAVVPVGVADPFGLARELHVEGGESGVHAGADAVLDVDDGGVDGIVGDDQGVALAESQEGPELQRGGRVCLHKSVADEDAVLVSD